MIYRLAYLLLACSALLAGVQVPNFVEQFANRVDAHWLEATQSLRGFQQIADQQFGGSIEALIRKHEASSDQVFHDEAHPIRALYERVRMLAAQQAGLRTGLPGRIVFIVLHGDRPLLREVWTNYSAAVPLDSVALACGFSLALLSALLLELLRFAVLRMLRS